MTVFACKSVSDLCLAREFRVCIFYLGYIRFFRYVNAQLLIKSDSRCKISGVSKSKGVKGLKSSLVPTLRRKFQGVSCSAHSRELDSISLATVVVKRVVCSATAAWAVKLGAEWVSRGIFTTALISKIWLVGDHAVLTSIEATLSCVWAGWMHSGPWQIHHVLNEFLLTFAQVVLTVVLGAIAKLIFLVVSLVDTVRALVNIETSKTLSILEADQIKFVHRLSISSNIRVLGQKLTVTAIIGDSFGLKTILFELWEKCASVWETETTDKGDCGGDGGNNFSKHFVFCV